MIGEERGGKGRGKRKLRYRDEGTENGEGSVAETNRWGTVVYRGDGVLGESTE